MLSIKKQSLEWKDTQADCRSVWDRLNNNNLAKGRLRANSYNEV